LAGALPKTPMGLTVLPRSPSRKKGEVLLIMERGGRRGGGRGEEGRVKEGRVRSGGDSRVYLMSFSRWRSSQLGIKTDVNK